MNTLKKIIGIIFGILFVSTAVPSLILFNFDRSAFTAETYQKAFAKDDFYGELPSVMAKAVTGTSTDQSKLPLLMRGLNQQALEAFFRTLLPQETLKSMGDDVLNSTFAYLNMQTNTVQLSLIPLKKSMSSDAGVQAAYMLLKTQPDCTFTQIVQITLDLMAKSEIQLCNPPVELQPTLTPIIQEQMRLAALTIPDQVTLINSAPENDLRTKLYTARMAMRLSPILPLMFLLLMTFAAVNSIKGWLNWWGVPFTITGLITGLLGLSGAPIFGLVIQRILVKKMADYLPTILLDYTNDLASAMIQALLNPILWQGLLFAFTGLAMVIGAYFIKRK